MGSRSDSPRSKRTAYNTLDAIKAAGLGPVKRKAKSGAYLILGLFVLAVLGAGVYFGLTYWMDTDLPESGVRPPSGYQKLEDQNLPPDEAARIRSVFEYSGEPSEDRPHSVPRRKTMFERQLLAFYRSHRGEKTERVPVEPRYADGMLIETGPITGPTTSGKKEATPTGPKVYTGVERLTNFQINAVVSKHYKRIKRHLERILDRYPELAGKLVLIVRVRPDGAVERVRAGTPKYHGTQIEEFLVKDVKRWKFPAFDGVPYDLTFPLLLSSGR